MKKLMLSVLFFVLSHQSAAFDPIGNELNLPIKAGVMLNYNLLLPDEDEYGYDTQIAGDYSTGLFSGDGSSVTLSGYVSLFTKKNYDLRVYYHHTVFTSTLSGDLEDGAYISPLMPPFSAAFRVDLAPSIPVIIGYSTDLKAKEHIIESNNLTSFSKGFWLKMNLESGNGRPAKFKPHYGVTMSLISAQIEGDWFGEAVNYQLPGIQVAMDVGFSI